MPTWANCKAGSTGSSESANNAAGDLELFTSSTTKGYNYSSGTVESGNGKWEAVCFGRAHSYNSTDHTYSYSLYVFAKKLNNATSWGDSFKVVFYYRGKTYTASGLTRYLNGSGETRLISSHTFTDLSWTPNSATTIGAKVTGEEDTEVYQTIDLTGTMDMTPDTWTSSVVSDSQLKVNTTKKIGSRGVRHARLWQYKKDSADSYTTAHTSGYTGNNSSDASSYTYSDLTRGTKYDLRVQFRLRNYDPSDETTNNTVILGTSGLTYTTTLTTKKSDLSGSVSLSGTNQVGKTLTATVTNTNSATLEYQWSYDTNSSFGSGDGTQTAISGATSKTLTVPTAAYGNYVYCKVTFTKDGYNTKTIRKYTSGKTAKQPFANSDTSVTISGSNQMNGTLTASVTSGSSGTISYQWWTATSSTATSGTAISGATSKTFKVTSAQIGKYIGVTVTLAASPTYLGGSVNDITSGKAAEIAPTVTAPSMKSSLTYAGSALALINAGKVTNGTMYYYASTSSSTPAASSVSSTSVPTGLPTTAGAAQTYHVWYKVVGNAGYTDVGVTKIGSVAVNPGTFTVTKVPFSGNYDGSAHKASIKVNLAGCTVKSGTASGTYGTTDSSSSAANTAITLGATSRTNAGSTTVYYQVSKNYYTTVTGSTTITINRLALSGTATITSNNGAKVGATLTAGVTTPSNGTKTYQWWYSTSSSATSGTNISGATGSTYTVASGMDGKYIGVTVSIAQGTNHLAGTLSDITNSAIGKTAGSGSVTMSGWTYGSTVPNPVPSSSTNGTSNVSYKWYNSNKTELSAKPTSTSNAGIYYVRATFPATSTYGEYTTGYVGFVVLPSISFTVSQNYLDGDYGILTGTITYSLGGGVGSCTSISLTNGNRILIDHGVIKESDSIHPNFGLPGSTITYSIIYTDENNKSKTLTGTKTFSLNFTDSFTYDYSHKNENGEKVSGMLKDFANDGIDKTKQFCLTAEEWNQMNKYLYSAAVRKNEWSNLGIPVPTEVSQGNRLSAILFNSALEIAEIITNTTYNQVTSGSRITSEQLNGFINILNNKTSVMFTIDGVSYSVDEGTTWKQFADANGLNCESDGDNIWDSNYDFILYNSDGTYCNGGDIITEDAYTWGV